MKVFLHFLIFTYLHSTFQKKCRTLILEGGGDKGSYEAGVIYGLVNNLPLEETQYDFISGVSVGGLNAAGLAQFAKGDEKNMADFIKSVWQNLTAGDVFKNWPWGIIQGLISKPSLFDSSPLRNFLLKTFDGDVKRNFSVGSVDANNATFVRFSGNNLTKEELVKRIMASSAIPVIFPHIDIDNETYIDGGTLLNLDAEHAIDFCLKNGFEEKDIIVDAILCDGKEIDRINADNDKSLQMLWRYVQIYSYSNSLDDLLQAKEDYPKVEWRYIVMPNKTLPSGFLPIQFNRKQMDKMIALGESDAKKAIEEGPGKDFERIFEEAENSKKTTNGYKERRNKVIELLNKKKSLNK